MAKNQKRENGRHARVTPTDGAATSGAPGILGQRGGVAEDTLGTDGKCTMDFEGVYALSVKGVITGPANQAVAVGDILYYNSGHTPKLDKDVAGVRFGYAMGTVTSGSTATIDVKVGY
jgi:predicted RecA/RadA family phage recombinase